MRVQGQATSEMLTNGRAQGLDLLAVAAVQECQAAYPEAEGVASSRTGDVEPQPAAPPPQQQATQDEVVSDGSQECPASPTERVGGEQAAICLYRAWLTQDRDLANVYGEEPAVAQMFDLPKTDSDPPWTFDGCVAEPATGAATCVFDAGWMTGQMELGGGPSVGNVVSTVTFLGD